MEIKILHLVEGARNAAGLTVVIDVFRAFSTACYVMNNGAEKIIPVGDIALAYKLKEENPEYILIGERKGRKQPGFDFGNSPTHVEGVDFSRKTVVQTTSAGTQGIANAINADEVISGSFVNAHAIVKYIKRKNPQQVSLVCMGIEAIRNSDEDTFGAEYIRSLLMGEPYDTVSAVEKLKAGSGKRFFDPRNSEWGPERDFYLCLDIGRFDFVLKLEKDSGEPAFFRKVRL